MKFLDSIKSMFTNKKEVFSHRFSLIRDMTFVYCNDRMLYFDDLGSTVLNITFDNELFFEFIQLAEGFASGKWKSFPFKDRTVVLVHLTTLDIKSILTTTRYADNPMCLKFLQEIHAVIPYTYLRDCKQCGDEGYLRYEITIGDDEDLYDLTTEQIHTKYLPTLSLPNLKVVSYDDINIVRSDILYHMPGLAPYLHDWDMLDLCHIFFYDGEFTYNCSYRELINVVRPNMFVANPIAMKHKDAVDLMAKLIENNILNDDLVNMDKPPAREEDQEELDEVIFDNPEVPDTSNVPQSNYIKGE